MPNSAKHFPLGNRQGSALHIFRCVYCKIRINDRMKIAAHEAQCSMRDAVKAMWQHSINKSMRNINA